MQLTARSRGRRWSDNDRHWGPFTYSRDDPHNRPLSFVIDSGKGEHPGCHLLVRGFGHTVLVELPAIIKPAREWVDTSRYEWSNGPGAGYWDEHNREFGFSYHQGFLQVFHGQQTHDSRTDRTWCKHLPWTQLHFHRHSFYGLEGEHLRSWLEPRRRQKGAPWFDRWQEQREFKDSMPKVRFAFTDFDGEAIEVTTVIEEREWTFGDGRFQWLRFFRRGKVSRSLDLDFNKEVGPEKGSWKGGTTGHSIEMLPGELHEDAFRRYCEQEHRSKYRPYRITFVGKVTS